MAIKQAMYLPFIWVGIILIGFATPDYSSITQHISELGNYDLGAVSSILYKSGVYLVALSPLAFFVGLVIHEKKISASIILGVVYSVGMLSNAVFPMGTPLHGLYGLPIFSVVLPAIFALEYSMNDRASFFVKFSIFVTVANLIYLWVNLVGLDPVAYRGLTQRLAIFVLNIWIAVAAYFIVKKRLSSQGIESEVTHDFI